jgi:hypothetical protein
MVVIKYDDDSWFKEFDPTGDISSGVSDIIWTGQVELAKKFNEYDASLTDTIETLIDEHFLPLEIEEVK